MMSSPEVQRKRKRMDNNIRKIFNFSAVTKILQKNDHQEAPKSSRGLQLLKEFSKAKSLKGNLTRSSTDNVESNAILSRKEAFSLQGRDNDFNSASPSMKSFDCSYVKKEFQSCQDIDMNDNLSVLNSSNIVKLRTPNRVPDQALASGSCNVLDKNSFRTVHLDKNTNSPSISLRNDSLDDINSFALDSSSANNSMIEFDVPKNKCSTPSNFDTKLRLQVSNIDKLKSLSKRVDGKNLWKIHSSKSHFEKERGLMTNVNLKPVTSSSSTLKTTSQVALPCMKSKCKVAKEVLPDSSKSADISNSGRLVASCSKRARIRSLESSSSYKSESEPNSKKEKVAISATSYELINSFTVKNHSLKWAKKFENKRKSSNSPRKFDKKSSESSSSGNSDSESNLEERVASSSISGKSKNLYAGKKHSLKDAKESENKKIQSSISLRKFDWKKSKINFSSVNKDLHSQEIKKNSTLNRHSLNESGFENMNIINRNWHGHGFLNSSMTNILSGQDKSTYFLVGDSNAFRWHKFLMFRGLNHWVNHGVPGAKVFEISKQCSYLYDNIVIVIVGTNDLLWFCHRDNQESMSNWKSRISAQLVKLNGTLMHQKCRVIWVEVLPCPRLEGNHTYEWARNFMNRIINKFKSDCVQIIESNDFNLDHFERFKWKWGVRREDLIHLNSSGHLLLLRKFYSVCNENAIRQDEDIERQDVHRLKMNVSLPSFRLDK